MYIVLAYCSDESGTFYAVSDGVADEPEIVSAEDLKLLLEFALPMNDGNNNPVTLIDGEIQGYIQDITDTLRETMYEGEENEDDWYEEDYDEDFDDSNEDFDDGLDEGDSDEGDWYEEEEYDVDDDDEDDWYEEEYEDWDEITEFYYDWKSGNVDTEGYGTNHLSRKSEDKDFSDLEESTESKLYKHLTDEQKKLLQEYYLYISRRIFNLERGVNNLPIRRKTDLDSIRNTGDSWVYAGFIDMGYAGTSICPFCHSALGATALSSCHKAPVVRKGLVKEKGSKNKKQGIVRTHNGVCSYPGCRAHCSTVTAKVGVRDINRDNQNGIICETCGKLVPQSSHYCTFNDPVRYMHVAWDVSVSDLDTNFYGQFVDDSIENLIDSNNCIKFGLTCTAEFFDIAKNSEAFKALENVQNTCKKDMELLQEDYEKGEVHCNSIMSSFGILDSIVSKLILLASKHALLKSEELLPGRLLSLYKEMRSANMLIPKSFIQFIRDFLVDWDTHKFIDRSKNFPTLSGSIGSVAGAKTGKASAQDCRDRLALVVNGVLGKRSAVLCDWIKKPYLSDRFQKACVNYTVAFFIYGLCGYYKYDAINQGDEGGKDQDKEGYGKHAQELKYFYRGITSGLPSKLTANVSSDFNLETLIALCDLINLHARLYKALNFRFVTKVLRSKTVEDRGREFKQYYIEEADSSYARSIVYPFKHYDDRLADVISDLNMGSITSSLRYGSYEDFMTKYSEVTEYLEGVVKVFPAFEEEYLRNEMDRRNAEELSQFESTSDIEIATPESVMTYLRNQELDKYADSDEFSFAVRITKQLLNSSKSPTSRQFNYIKPLYEKISGEQYTGTDPESRGLEDLDMTHVLKCADYVYNNPSVVDSFTRDVMQTVKKRGTVSEKQKRYVLKALKACEGLV